MVVKIMNNDGGYEDGSGKGGERAYYVILCWW